MIPTRHALLLTLPLLAPAAVQGQTAPVPDSLRGPVRPPPRATPNRAAQGRTTAPPRLLGVPAAAPPPAPAAAAAASAPAPPALVSADRLPPPPPLPAEPVRFVARASGEVHPAAWRARPEGCVIRELQRLGRNPTAAELRCRYGAQGPGRFGLLSYLDVPVYQPRTPMPGTHVVGVPGMPHPAAGESYEQWEWRVLRSSYGAAVRGVRRETELLDPVFASRLLQFEHELRSRGISAQRRETWRSPERQAWIFQQGRSRPGPIATSTLTSWHNRVDRLGRAAARAADYAVAPRDLPRFHQLAAELKLESYGADSNDPGHVYLPDTDAASGMEVAVLRLLPRVPYVTLETGRPADETPIPGMPAYWRELLADFLSRPAAAARTDLTLPSLPVGVVRPPPAPPRPAAPPTPARGRRGRRG